MRIAAWNIERLKHKKSLEQILLVCEQTQADVLVLTEADRCLCLWQQAKQDNDFSLLQPCLTEKALQESSFVQTGT